jgi:dipeptidyl aminopeptidase/acylaminoacyl peptidase
MRNRLAPLALAAALTVSTSCRHAPVRTAVRSELAAFTSHDELASAKVSPGGTYLATLTFDNGQRVLSFMELATRRFTWVLKPSGDTTIGGFTWVNDERVVVEMVDQSGELAPLATYGELYAVNANGRGGRVIFGYRAGEMQTGTHFQRAQSDYAWGRVVSRIRNDPRRVLVGATAMDEVGDRVESLYRLDVYTGVKTFVATGPVPGTDYLADDDGEPRVAFTRNVRGVARVFYRERGEGWRELTDLKGLSPGRLPVAFAPRARQLYIEDASDEGFTLHAVGIDGGDRKLVASHAKVPPRHYVVDPATGRPVAIEYEPDLPGYEILEEDAPTARALRGLLAAFPQEHVRLVQVTDDGKKAVAHVYSDRDPGRFLLVDVAKITAEPIASVRPWIEPGAMAEKMAFHIDASDGLRIHGYLTLPRQRTPDAPPPLVVRLHGGPHGVRDGWGFDPEVQLLASQGFAVLQVNYRGSGGYGPRYEQAGYRRWGDRVVQDVVDATRFAVAKGYVDPQRICAYGGSFGAYAAVQSAVVAPDLFRCAIGYAGVYDLGLLARDGGGSQSKLTRDYGVATMGTDEAALRRVSPVYNADRLAARVLLIHGGRDRTAPIEHAERLRKALAEKGRAPEWLVEPREAHGFYDEEARERMYARVVAFLKANLAAAPAPATAAR